MTDKKTRYHVEDALFDKEHGILKNKQVISDKEKLDSLEIQHLLKAYEQTALEYSENHTFTEKDVRYLHELFLGKIYDWAGEYRSVDISSADIRYCHAAYIAQNMVTFEKMLQKLTPFSPRLSPQEIVERLAKIHGELIVIHPFRDGNGRTTRLLCDLLLMQAEYDPIDTATFYNEDFLKEYHLAIQEVWKLADYSRLINLLTPLIVK